MDKGMHGIKHSHLFKAEAIIKKQKESRRQRTFVNQSQNIEPSSYKKISPHRNPSKSSVKFKDTSIQQESVNPELERNTSDNEAS